MAVDEKMGEGEGVLFPTSLNLFHAKERLDWFFLFCWNEISVFSLSENCKKILFFLHLKANYVFFCKMIF